MGDRRLMYDDLMWAKSSVLSLCCLLGVATVAEADPAQDLTIRAAAPLAFNEADLGRPVSTRFEPLIGKDGKTIFPGAKTRRTTVNSFWYDFQSIDTSSEFGANARAWMIDASASNASDTRYVVYRAVQVTSAVELDDTEDPRTVGPDGAYYVRKIYFGRVYELVYSGSADAFTIDVRAELVTASGALDFQKRHKEIEWKVFARGLVPKSEAIFARSPKDIQDKYVEDKTYNAGNPVPVLVEYRRIPGAPLENFAELAWKQPSPSASQVKLRFLHVDGRSDQWTDTGLTLSKNDILIAQADGKVTVGAFMGTMGPGTDGVGRLDMNIDGIVAPVSKKQVTTHQPGAVRLKVYDTDYSDNSGQYDVVLVLIPEGALRASDCLKNEQGANLACHYP